MPLSEQDILDLLSNALGRRMPPSLSSPKNLDPRWSSPQSVIDFAHGKYGTPGLGLTSAPPIVRQIAGQVEKEFGSPAFSTAGEISPELARRLNEYVTGGRQNRFGGVSGPDVFHPYGAFNRSEQPVVDQEGLGLQVLDSIK